MPFFHVDPTSDDQFNAWFDILRRSESAREDGRGWLPQERRAKALDTTAALYQRLYSLGDDVLNPVAIAALEFTDDHAQWIRGELHVDPTHRRHGHGAAAIGHLEEIVRDMHRPALVMMVTENLRELGHGTNRAFAPAVGFHVAEEDIRRDLPWPRPEGELDRLEREWSPLARDYDILSWAGGVPESFVSERARLATIMPHEVPEDDFDQGDEHWDEDRVRAHQQMVIDMGRDLLAAVAQHRESGELVGFSELTVAREQPAIAYQWDTLVVSGHRGHRLGGLMKIATMRLLEAGGYATKSISTNNAAINEHMIAVNEQLGAAISGSTVIWRKFLN